MQILILAIIDNKVVGPIYSIALTGLRIRNPGMKGGLQTVLPHAPVTEEMLSAAATELVASDGPTADHPDFSEAYLEFSELYDHGEAGVFTRTLPEIVDLTEKAIASVET
ncbi:hypothetical protein [uncultured Roseibium sp.]|uniref:hypothetical protein n=1 Tax=uncultured Roseibium sp. TaxID=1936171 RepID=UPI0032172BA3